MNGSTDALAILEEKVQAGELEHLAQGRGMSKAAFYRTPLNGRRFGLELGNGKYAVRMAGDGPARFEPVNPQHFAGHVTLVAQKDPPDGRLDWNELAGVPGIELRTATYGNPPYAVAGLPRAGQQLVRIGSRDALARFLAWYGGTAASPAPAEMLRAFQERTQDLPRATDAERLVVQRVGQGIFRAGLMALWGGRCPLTGIDEPALLRASHIKPWAQCADDAERLSPDNGLLLSALWDAAFDAGLVTFEDDGTPCFARDLGVAARGALGWIGPLPVTPRHRPWLAWHRARIFAGGAR